MKALKTKAIIAVICPVVLGVAPPAWAGPLTVTVEATMSAWYEQRFSIYTGPSTNQNYVVGFSPGSFGDKTWRYFFAFDLSAVDETAVAADLHLTRGTGGGLASFAMYTLYEVTASPQDVMAGGTNEQKAAIWSDLGSGVVYGSAEIPNSGDATDIVAIELNAEALEGNNAADGLLVLGGALSPASTSGGVRFGHTHPGSRPLGDVPPIRRLVLTVPEPSSVVLAVLGLSLFLAFICRRRRGPGLVFTSKR